jgi:hypothetical protein
MGVSPKRDTNFFNNLADTGMFIEYGFLLILIGIVILVGSVFFLRTTMRTHDPRFKTRNFPQTKPSNPPLEPIARLLSDDLLSNDDGSAAWR